MKTKPADLCKRALLVTHVNMTTLLSMNFPNVKAHIIHLKAFVAAAFRNQQVITQLAMQLKPFILQCPNVRKY